MFKSLSAEVVVPQELSPISKSILRTLIYFDIFNHPLQANEIHQYLYKNHTSLEDTANSLDYLLQSGFLKKKENYFLLNSNSNIIERRKEGEAQSARAIKTAQKYSRIIAAFPFVRAVFISGSLSKGYMDKDADIDYFIITAPERLWLTRTVLMLFKKIFLLNSRKDFCLNYFVASDNLEIPDRNIFTATELVSVIPTFNYSEYKSFLAHNTWSQEFLPNIHSRSAEFCIKPKNKILKIFFENIFRAQIGEALDAFCFRLTLRFWKKKFKHFNVDDFDHRLRSRKNVSKHHPRGYQFKVLKTLDEKIKLFELQHGIIL
jgi:hypothetical protein